MIGTSNGEYFKRSEKNRTQISSTKISESEENCIIFPFNELEDFYLQNKPSREFASDSQFIFTKNANNTLFSQYRKKFDFDDEKTLDLELFGVDLTMTSSVSCETPPVYSFNKFDFSQMDTCSILALKLSISDLIENDLFIRLTKDQYGSRYIQKLLNRSGGDLKRMISLLIIYLYDNKQTIDLIDISKHIYGNYLIQLLFSYGNEFHREILLNFFVYDSVFKLSQSKYGCRVIQKILFCVENEYQLIRLINCFQEQSKTLLQECLLCCEINHVIQAIIELKLPFRTVEFIAKELENDLVLYCENIYACRVVQSFIKNYGNQLAVNKLFINGSHLFLSQVKYGNYVIQCIIKKNEWYSSLSKITQFRNKLISDVFSMQNILFLSKDKHASNVVETCIKVANQKQIEKLINSLCSNKAQLLSQIISDRFGNYIPKTLLQNCNQKQQEILINSTHEYIIDLRNSSDKLKQCATFIQMCQDIKYAN